MTTQPLTLTQPAIRGRFEGVAQILRFNYPMFLTAVGMTAAGVIILLWVPLPSALSFVLAAVLLLAMFWTLATLAVAHLVYDCHPTFRFTWLPPEMPKRVHRWANVHAGFDQTTPLLRETFPQAKGTAIDVFDPQVMTERSIHRARSVTPPIAGTQPGAYDHLPLASGSIDTIFFLFAAHELRTPSQRAALFLEAARALQPGGNLVVLEHLRSLPNLLAFGPGAFHFHSRRQWPRAARGARLTLVAQTPVTPFATAFLWRKQP